MPIENVRTGLSLRLPSLPRRDQTEHPIAVNRLSRETTSRGLECGLQRLPRVGKKRGDADGRATPRHEGIRLQ
jgi:hypothetical protein